MSIALQSVHHFFDRNFNTVTENALRIFTPYLNSFALADRGWTCYRIRKYIVLGHARNGYTLLHLSHAESFSVRLSQVPFCGNLSSLICRYKTYFALLQ